jgi:hypothetical protein
MDKVVMEAGKSRGRNMDAYAEKHNPYKKLPLEEQPTFEGMHKKLGYERKHSAWTSQPIQRWLETKIGSNWDAAYSEFCKVFKPTQTIRTEIRKWAVRDMKQSLVEQEGKIYSVSWWFHELHDGDIYVDPKTNIIKKYKVAKIAKVEEPVEYVELTRSKEKTDDYKLSGFTFKESIDSYVTGYKKIDGIWYKIWGHFTKSTYRRSSFATSKEQPTVYWKKQLNKKQLKELKLTNG